MMKLSNQDLSTVFRRLQKDLEQDSLNHSDRLTHTGDVRVESRARSFLLDHKFTSKLDEIF